MSLTSPSAAALSRGAGGHDLRPWRRRFTQAHPGRGVPRPRSTVVHGVIRIAFAACHDLHGEPMWLAEDDSDGYLVATSTRRAWPGSRFASGSSRRRRAAWSTRWRWPTGTVGATMIEAAISERPDELLEGAIREAALTLALPELGGD